MRVKGLVREVGLGVTVSYCLECRFVLDGCLNEFSFLGHLFNVFSCIGSSLMSVVVFYSFVPEDSRSCILKINFKIIQAKSTAYKFNFFKGILSLGTVTTEKLLCITYAYLTNWG